VWTTDPEPGEWNRRRIQPVRSVLEGYIRIMLKLVCWFCWKRPDTASKFRSLARIRAE